MLDNSVACCVVASSFAVTGVCIEDVGVAAVVVDSQAVAILLEDVACFCIACTANEVRYMTARPFYAVKRLGSNLINYFIVPCRTILKPQVSSTSKC